MTCQYPRGEKPDYDFCGKPTKLKEPYCAEHLELCRAKPEPKQPTARPPRFVYGNGR